MCGPPPLEEKTAKECEEVWKAAARALEVGLKASSAAGCCPAALNSAANVLHALIYDELKVNTESEGQDFIRKAKATLAKVLAGIDDLLALAKCSSTQGIVKTQGLVKDPAGDEQVCNALPGAGVASARFSVFDKMDK